MNDDVDTVTPLDGDGRNVTFPNGDDDALDNISLGDYETRGKTTVATRPGFVFAPSDKSLPLITREGVKMSKENAEAVVKEAESTRAGVHIVSDDENESE